MPPKRKNKGKRKKGYGRAGGKIGPPTQQQAASRKRKSKGAAKAGGMTAYKRLLLDPCYAPMTHLPGLTTTGNLLRFESDFIIGEGAGQTAGVVVWRPGGMMGGTPEAVNTDNGFIYAQRAVDTDSWVFAAPSVAAGNTVATYVPGYSYLQSNARAYVCVAACARLMWPGSEQNRQGFVFGGDAPSFALTVGAPNYTVAGLRATAPKSVRMPANDFEVKWRPGTGDLSMQYPGSTGTDYEVDSRTSLYLGWSGLPAATGVRIRFTAVYEYLPPLVLGMVPPMGALSVSGENPARAIAELDKSNPQWVYSKIREYATAGAITALMGGMRMLNDEL